MLTNLIFEYFLILSPRNRYQTDQILRVKRSFQPFHAFNTYNGIKNSKNINFCANLY